MYETTIGGHPTVMYTTVETAKEIRKALKAAFPKVKFSVRSHSYAGGASVSVHYNDRDVTAMSVRAVTNNFNGATFDPMIDLKSYRYAEHEGRRVSWGADYVHVYNDANW